MKIGILETGKVSPKLKPKYGTYGSMFRVLLNNFFPDANFVFFNVLEHEFPKNVQEVSLWVITGSHHGIYENLDWMNTLKSFIVESITQGIPILGVCFGHQILADVMGGKVEKFKNGWGLGVHQYKFYHKNKWTSPIHGSYKGFAVHQDQVVLKPPSSKCLAGSDFCQNAILAYGNDSRPFALSIQTHPEFTKEYAYDLIALRSGKTFPKQEADCALKTLEKTTDNLSITKAICGALVR